MTTRCLCHTRFYLQKAALFWVPYPQECFSHSLKCLTWKFSTRCVYPSKIDCLQYSLASFKLSFFSVEFAFFTGISSCPESKAAFHSKKCSCALMQWKLAGEDAKKTAFRENWDAIRHFSAIFFRLRFMHLSDPAKQSCKSAYQASLPGSLLHLFWG